MILPTLRDKLENWDYEIFVSFCATPLEEILKGTNYNFNNRFSLFKCYKNNNADIMPVLNKYFKKYMVGFKYVDDSLYWGERLVSKEVFEIFCMYCAIACGVKSIEDSKLIITEEMDDDEKHRIELEKKIRKTKQQGSKASESTSLDLILAGVCREFHYTYNELLDMTIYSIYYMYSLFGPIMNYQIGNIAAGNGLLKSSTEHNHWTNQRLKT